MLNGFCTVDVDDDDDVGVAPNKGVPLVIGVLPNIRLVLVDVDDID